jgi:hypothetical protein
MWIAWHRCHGGMRAAGSDASLGAWVRRVAAQVTSQQTAARPTVGEAQSAPKPSQQAGPEGAQEDAATADEGLNQKRPRRKSKTRKSAKRCRVAAAGGRSRQHGVLAASALMDLAVVLSQDFSCRVTLRTTNHCALGAQHCMGFRRCPGRGGGMCR